jgi:3-demethoxyubiquinol 3-hydroxylase
MSSTRHFSPFDHAILQVDSALRTLFGAPVTTERANPATTIAEADLPAASRQLAGRLMRINHAGEVSAQGLYQGQALTARLPTVREKMARAAQEENDHLEWCRSRAEELGTHVSRLNPLWYLGSLAIGAAAGAAGDKWSLGFVVETERQVVAHLDEHLAQIDPADGRSRAILEQMKIDEAHHATTALDAGGAALPLPVRLWMKLTSKVMTRTTWWI